MFNYVHKDELHRKNILMRGWCRRKFIAVKGFVEERREAVKSKKAK